MLAPPGINGWSKMSPCDLAERLTVWGVLCGGPGVLGPVAGGKRDRLSVYVQGEGLDVGIAIPSRGLTDDVSRQ